MDNLTKFISSNQATRIHPGETFTVRLKLPPIPTYIVGLRWESKIKAKWRKRRMRLAHLQALKEDRRRTRWIALLDFISSCVTPALRDIPFLTIQAEEENE